MQSNPHGGPAGLSYAAPEEQTNTPTTMLDLEKLGKERPEIFSGQWPELAFCFSIVMSQILAVSREQTLLPGPAN